MLDISLVLLACGSTLDTSVNYIDPIMFDTLDITKISPCNEDPLTPHFYIVKLGFTGVYIFSYFCSKT